MFQCVNHELYVPNFSWTECEAICLRAKTRPLLSHKNGQWIQNWRIYNSSAEKGNKVTALQWPSKSLSPNLKGIFVYSKNNKIEIHIFIKLWWINQDSLSLLVPLFELCFTFCSVLQRQKIHVENLFTVDNNMQTEHPVQ